MFGGEVIRKKFVIGSFQRVVELPYVDPEWGQEAMAKVLSIATWFYNLEDEINDIQVEVYLKVALPNSQQVILDRRDIAKQPAFHDIYHKAMRQAWASISRRKLGHRIEAEFHYTGRESRQPGGRHGTGYTRHLGGK